jgi:hypothetical protein
MFMKFGFTYVGFLAEEDMNQKVGLFCTLDMFAELENSKQCKDRLNLAKRRSRCPFANRRSFALRQICGQQGRGCQSGMTWRT